MVCLSWVVFGYSVVIVLVGIGMLVVWSLFRISLCIC